MIKKKQSAFLLVFLLVSVVALAFALGAAVENKGSAIYASTDAKDKNITVLLAGLDEAGGNTDVLMLLSLKGNGELNILQIPRDTYIKTDGYEGKINHIYPNFVEKYGRKNGAESFSSTMSDALGVTIDRYAVFSGKALEELVDALGGVTLTVPHTFSYADESGKECTVFGGEQDLSGRDALAFLRHRSQYTEGDLGRLDAQMRFIAALAKEALARKDLKTYFRIYQKSYRNLLTNLGEKDIINTIQVFCSCRDRINAHIMRLPGEACQSENGAWYYFLNKNATADLLHSCFSGNAPSHFDKKHRFLKENEQAAVNIYEAKRFDMRIYTLDEAEKVRVLHK